MNHLLETFPDRRALFSLKINRDEWDSLEKLSTQTGLSKGGVLRLGLKSLHQLTQSPTEKPLPRPAQLDAFWSMFKGHQ